MFPRHRTHRPPPGADAAWRFFVEIRNESNAAVVRWVKQVRRDIHAAVAERARQLSNQNEELKLLVAEKKRALTSAEATAQWARLLVVGCVYVARGVVLGAARLRHTKASTVPAHMPVN